jgi:hypothetical protein
MLNVAAIQITRPTLFSTVTNFRVALSLLKAEDLARLSPVPLQTRLI